MSERFRNWLEIHQYEKHISDVLKYLGFDQVFEIGYKSSATHQLFRSSVVIMSSADDPELVKQCLRGEPRAFETLVDRYQRVVFNIALRMVGAPEDARGITQTVFLKVYENLESFDSRHKFFIWICRIVVNESLNYLRVKKTTDQLDENVVAGGKPQDEPLQDNQMLQSLERALMNMSFDQRVVLVLKHFQGLSYRDIGHILDIPEKTVKSRLFSGRQDLKEILSHKIAD